MSQLKPVTTESVEQLKESPNQPLSLNLRLANLINQCSSEQLWQLAYRSTAQLPIFGRRQFFSAFVNSLETSGVNIFRFFFLLGINIENKSEITPTDFAMLVRYFKLHENSIFSLAIEAISENPEIVRSIIKQINK